MPPTQSVREEILIPEGLTDQDEDGPRGKRNTYKIISDEDVVSAGMMVEGFNYPVVQVPSAAAMSANGGSMGFDSRKPFAMLVDRTKNPFVIDDISKIPPEILNQISKEAETEILKSGSSADPGQIIVKILRKKLAATDKSGLPLTHLSTWINDNHDPFRREVRLGQSAFVKNHTTTIKKGVAMHGQPGFFPAATPSRVPTPMHPLMTPAGHAAAGHQTGHPPIPGQPFGPSHFHSANRGTSGPAPVQPPRIPAPDKVVQFHLGGGMIQSRYHYVDVVDQPTVIDGMMHTVRYLILVRNNAAAAAGDNFTPHTPAPGAELWVTLPDGSNHQVHSVMLTYDIKSTSHIILYLLTEPPAQEQPSDFIPEPEMGQLNDPLDSLGEAAVMTPEDAVTG